MLWLVFVTLCLFFNVSFTIISRVNLSTTTKYTNAYTVLWEALTGLFGFAFLPFGVGSLHLTPHLLVVGGVSLLLYTISNFFIFNAFRYEEASVLSVIFPLNNLFTFLTSIIIFGALFNGFSLLGFACILGAVLLSQYFQSKFRFSKGSMYGLLFALFIGLALGFDAQVVQSFSVTVFTIMTFLVPAVLNQFIFLRPKFSEIAYEFRHQKLRVILNALAQCLSTFFLYKAFTVGGALQVISVFALSTIIVTIIGILFLRERDHILPKLVSASVAVIGVILINK